MTKFCKFAFFLVLFYMVTSFFCGCKTHVATTKKQLPAPDIKKLLVMPFRSIESVYEKPDKNDCPLCGRTFISDFVSDKSLSYMTNVLFRSIKVHTDYNIVFAKNNQSVPSVSNVGSEHTAASERAYLVESGLAQNADAVLVGYVYRFRDRVGKQYSVESPASVAFEMHIVRVEDKRILWSGHFDETQRPLSQNLFQIGKFFKRKAKWITAEQMALSALEEMLNNLGRQ